MIGLPLNFVGRNRDKNNLEMISSVCDQSADDTKFNDLVKKFLNGETCNLTSLYGSKVPAPGRLLRLTEMKTKLALSKPKAISMEGYVKTVANSTNYDKFVAEQIVIGGFQLSEKTLHIMSNLDYQIDLRLDLVKGTIINFALDLDYVQMVIKISTQTSLQITEKCKVILETTPTAPSTKLNFGSVNVLKIQQKQIHSRTSLDNSMLKLHDQVEPVWTRESMALAKAIWEILLECDYYKQYFKDHCSYDNEMKSIIKVDGKSGFYKMTQPPLNIEGKEFVHLNIGPQDTVSEPSKVFIGSTTVEILTLLLLVRTALKIMIAALRNSTAIGSDEAKDASSNMSSNLQIVSCNRKLLELATLLFLMHSNPNICAVFESFNGKTRGLKTNPQLELKFQESTTKEELTSLADNAAEVLFSAFEQNSFAGKLKNFFVVTSTKIGVGIDARPENAENICMLPNHLQNNGTILLGEKALNAVARNLPSLMVTTDKDSVSVLTTERNSYTLYGQLLLPEVVSSFTCKQVNSDFVHEGSAKEKESTITGMQLYSQSFRNVDRGKQDNSFGSLMGDLRSFMHGEHCLRLSSAIEQCDKIETQIFIAGNMLHEAGPMPRIEITHSLHDGLTLGSLKNACFETILLTKENAIVLSKKVTADYFLLMALVIVSLHRAALLSVSSNTVNIERTAHLSYANIMGNYIQNFYSGRENKSENDQFQQLATKGQQRVIIPEVTNPMLRSLGLQERSDESSDEVFGSMPIPICLEKRAAYHLKSLLEFKLFPTCLHDSCNLSFFNIDELFAHLEKVPEHKKGDIYKTKPQLVKDVCQSFVKNSGLDIPQTQIVDDYFTGLHINTSSRGGAGKSRLLQIIISIQEQLHGPESILILCGQKLSGTNLHKNARTINSAFGMGIGLDLNTAEDFLREFKKLNVSYRHKKVIILDECFNTERRIGEGMVTCLEYDFGVPNIFSEIQFICVGDLKQLGNSPPPPPHPSPNSSGPLAHPQQTLTSPIPHPMQGLLIRDIGQGDRKIPFNA